MILVVNSGSSSLKFAFYQKAGDAAWPECIAEGAVNSIGSGADVCCVSDDSRLSELPSILQNAVKSMARLDRVQEAHRVLCEALLAIDAQSVIDSVCYRVVHGGSKYAQPVPITAAVRQQLELLVPFAPLHQPLALDAIDVFTKVLPNSKHLACFDTAFHRSMPALSQCFAIPATYTEQGVRPYGFHGLSYEYIAHVLRERDADLNKVVIAHLGGGASVCALYEGRSVATSMTFSPLDGLPMATRSGAIDAGAVLYMIEQLGMSPAEVSAMLNKSAGLLALSEYSGDVRQLLNSDSEKSEFAIKYFVSRIAQAIAAHIAVLEGVDALVFTGGIGANSVEIRSRVVGSLSWLGVRLADNQLSSARHEQCISASDSEIEVYAIKTNEELMMARHALDAYQLLGE